MNQAGLSDWVRTALPSVRGQGPPTDDRTAAVALLRQANLEKIVIGTASGGPFVAQLTPDDSALQTTKPCEKNEGVGRDSEQVERAIVRAFQATTEANEAQLFGRSAIMPERTGQDRDIEATLAAAYIEPTANSARASWTDPDFETITACPAAALSLLFDPAIEEWWVFYESSNDPPWQCHASVNPERIDHGGAELVSPTTAEVSIDRSSIIEQSDRSACRSSMGRAIAEAVGHSWVRTRYALHDFPDRPSLRLAKITVEVGEQAYEVSVHGPKGQGEPERLMGRFLYQQKPVEVTVPLNDELRYEIPQETMNRLRQAVSERLVGLNQSTDLS